MNRFRHWLENASRWQVVLLSFSMAVILYMVPNHHDFFAPQQLPFLPGEKSIPMIPWTSWVYGSLYFCLVAEIYLIPKPVIFRTMMWLVVMYVLHIGVFIFFPTTYPRELWGSGGVALEFIRLMDSPRNCFPSLHVSTCAYFAFILYWTRSRATGGAMLLWAFAILLSTLTTKQHYILDVLAAVPIAAFFARRALRS